MGNISPVSVIVIGCIVSLIIGFAVAWEWQLRRINKLKDKARIGVLLLFCKELEKKNYPLACVTKALRNMIDQGDV